MLSNSKIALLRSLGRALCIAGSFSLGLLTLPAPALARTPTSTPLVHSREAKSQGHAKTAAAQAIPHGGGFLWEVHDAEGHTLYLLGSIHVGDASLYPLPETIEAAFAKSDTLIVEADVDKADKAKLQAAFLSAGVASDGSSLKDKVSAKVYASTVKLAGDLGLNEAVLDHFEPWFAAVSLMTLMLQQAGITGEEGIEKHFLAEARGKLPIEELEGVEFQLSLFKSFTGQDAEAFLGYTLEDAKQLVNEAKKLLTAWTQGDLSHLEAMQAKVRNDPKAKRIYAALFTERNLKMADKIASALGRKQTSFVIAGAGHMVGEDGIVATLRSRGLRLVRR